MTKRASEILALAFALVAFAPTTARAERPEDRETARRSFQEGKERRDRGDVAGALESFLAADALMNVPTTKLAVARAFAALGRLVEARDAALAVARLPVASNEPQAFVDARTAAAQLGGELGERIPSLAITLGGARPASLEIDGVAIPEPAWSAPRRVNPGKHAIVTRLGAEETREVVSLEEREQKSVTLTVTRPSTGAPEAAPARSSPSASASPRPLGVLFWGGAGLAALGLGVGTATGALSMSAAGDAEALCQNGRCPPPAHDALDDAHRWASISTAGFVAAGVGALVLATGLILRPSTETPRRTGGLTIRPTLDGLTGSF